MNQTGKAEEKVLSGFGSNGLVLEFWSSLHRGDCRRGIKEERRFGEF